MAGGDHRMDCDRGLRPRRSSGLLHLSDSSPIIAVRMHPIVRCDLAFLGQLDHVYGRRVSSFFARPAFQHRLRFPDRRMTRTPYSVERRPVSVFATTAFDLQLNRTVDAPPHSTSIRISGYKCSNVPLMFIEKSGNGDIPLQRRIEIKDYEFAMDDGRGRNADLPLVHS